MRILVACIHYPVASGRFITNALRRLGHDVRTSGPTTGRRIWDIDVDERWAWTPDYLDSDNGEGVTVGLDSDWWPDLCISADSGYAVDFPLGPQVVWGMDNHVRDYASHQFDAAFFAHSWANRMGEPNVYWLPPCYDPEMHVMTTPHTARDIGVGMVAVPYQGRVELVMGLAQAGVEVTAGTGLLWDDYRTFYNRVKIALIQSAMGDLTQRFFEAMAMGCCVLCDKPRDADKLGFEPWIHYVPYTSTADAANKARHLLAGGRWIEYATRGHEKVQGHTWDARAVQLLETVEKMKEPSQ